MIGVAIVLLPCWAAPARAQDPNNPSAPLNDLVQNARDDATQATFEFSLGILTFQPSYIFWGKTANTELLQIAIRQRDYSASWVSFFATQLDATKATIEAVRSTLVDLQDQLTEARNAIGPQQAARIGEIESSLTQANSTLRQAALSKSYLEFKLVSTEYDLWKAQLQVGSAQRGLSFFNELAPRISFAVGVTQQVSPWIDLAKQGFDVASNSVYRSQPSEFNYQFGKLQFNLAATVAGDAVWAEILGPPAALLDIAHNARLTFNAMEHENSAERLAFGGVLSMANLPRLQFNHDYDYFSGSFGSTQHEGPLSITGSWVSHADLTADQFSAASRYTFEGLETSSGHILTGYGITWRDSVEQHSAFFNPLNAFDFGNNQLTTGTTRRYESYNDSFNGALANRSIQAAGEFSPRPNISIPFALPDLQLYDQEIRKRPPSLNTFGDGGGRGSGAGIGFQPPRPPPPPLQPPQPPDPARGGVTMPTTVVKGKATDKADTSDFFGSDHVKKN